MLTALIILLIQADDFPPKHTDCKNDNDTCGNQNEIDFVEPRSFKETLSEVDRAGTAGIFCNAPHEVRENGKADGNHQRRCTGSDRHSGKRNIHRRHMSRGSCKYVVKVNIGKASRMMLSSNPFR